MIQQEIPQLYCNDPAHSRQADDTQTPSDWADNIDGDKNCFDIIRLIFAYFVILNHSYHLAPNVDHNTLPFRIFAGPYNSAADRIDLGGVAVDGFFVISGFLIARSWRRSKSLWSYISKRAMRIAPAFLAASLLAVFCVGPLTSLSTINYLREQNWLQIFANIVSFHQVGLKDALIGLPESLVNGSLWSIRYEVDCYIMIALVGSLLLSLRFSLVVLLSIFMTLHLLIGFNVIAVPTLDRGLITILISNPDAWPDVIPFFLVGALFYINNQVIPRRICIFILSSLLMMLSVVLDHFSFLFPLFFAYSILYIASLTVGHIYLHRKRVDISYGVYVYGWMVQQLIVFYSLPAIEPANLFICSSLVVLPIAYVSWIFVESPCLTLAHAGFLAPARTASSSSFGPAS